MTGKVAGVGAMVGGLITAPLMAILYLGAQVAGLPFAPFDLFNLVARILPGDILALGVSSMVSVIGALNLGETSSTAKIIEQLMALALFWGLGVLAGSLFFVVQHARQTEKGIGAGALLGLIVSLPVLWLVYSVNQSATTALGVSLAWTLVAFVGWGAAIGWVYEKLAELPAGQQAVAEPADSSAGRAVTSSEQPAAGPPIEATALSRRQFLIRVGNASAVVTVVGAGLGVLLEASNNSTSRAAVDAAGGAAGQAGLSTGLPNAGATVIPAPGTRPEYTPLADYYRIDISLVPPNINVEEWLLPIDGLVDIPLALTLEDFRNNYEALDQYVTMSCISNQVGGDLIGTTKWTGVSLQAILADAGVQSEAGYLNITSADGFHEAVALDLIQSDERIMLCYAWDDEPLTESHGFPLRIYIPDRYGMKQPKWITSMEVVAVPEEGYWVKRGWDQNALVNTTSVVDTVAAEAIVEADGQMLVPVGGIAYAGARGISKIEVQVDSAGWQEAELRDPLSETTWVIWRYDWPFQEGRHNFAVRAYDGSGDLQSIEERGVRPSGATGTHRLNKNVVYSCFCFVRFKE
ncbi:molybdopterin-dependent oxidoreductase [Chloroflexota bacterium]